MNFTQLKLERQDFVATVWINREKVLNALNADVLRELKQCFDSLSEDHETRAIILTGAGEKAFVAGADIAAMSKMSPDEAAQFGKLGHEAMSAVENCRKPVIAAVNGFCLGGGLELALSCDFIFASERAKLGLPEVSLGLFPGWGGTQRLSRLIGRGRAKELILSGRMLSAEEALHFGIANRICKPEELLREARATAAEIAKKGPVAVSLAKKLINESCGTTLEEGLKRERTTFPDCFKTEDLKEGLAAFLEKRGANFKGR
ncbi:MAG: enoyl-CoA hydratase/isomerase family protein [Deltaproteobacteria bacterium]|nr:enoyl-CoA hydratase/isomerase family protein [Deltaproteobacteria bacterium]MBI2500387.1 enoyl-CoA hydratase/isomerase family protein [Deltaproteobacteria bacterium]